MPQFEVKYSYEGEWKKLSENLLEITVGYWGGTTSYKIEIVSLSSDELKIQYHYNNIYFCVDGSVQDPVAKPMGKGEKIVDPLFVDYEGRNLHLCPGSPAIDAGEVVDLKSDFDGNKIPYGKAPDIGAYEYSGKLVNPKQ